MLSALLLLAARAYASSSPSDLPVVADGTNAEELGEVDSVDVDEEVARSALDAGASVVEDSLAATSGLVDVTSLHDLEARHHGPSPWGRLDLVITWRRIDHHREAPGTLFAMPDEPSQRDEVWLVATWRN